jgi:hypothetical protein
MVALPSRRGSVAIESDRCRLVEVMIVALLLVVAIVAAEVVVACGDVNAACPAVTPIKPICTPVIKPKETA